MIGFYYAALAGVCAVLGLVYLRRRDTARLSILRETKNKLLPFAGSSASDRFSDQDELWRAIGGARGVVVILCAAGVISSAASRCARRYPAAETVADTIFWGGIWLRVTAIICLLEALMCRISPKCPRWVAGAMVRGYCELVLDLEAAESIGSVT